MKFTLLGKNDTHKNALDKITAESLALCVDDAQALEFVLKQKLHLI